MNNSEGLHKLCTNHSSILDKLGKVIKGCSKNNKKSEFNDIEHYCVLYVDNVSKKGTDLLTQLSKIDYIPRNIPRHNSEEVKDILKIIEDDGSVFMIMGKISSYIIKNHDPYTAFKKKIDMT